MPVPPTRRVLPSSPMPTSCRQPPRPLLVMPCCQWLTVPVASCSLGISMRHLFPLKRNSGQITWSPIYSEPFDMPWWRPRGRVNGWKNEAQIPGEFPDIVLPLPSWLIVHPSSSTHAFNLLTWGSARMWPRGIDIYLQAHFSLEPRAQWILLARRQRSLPLQEHRVLLKGLSEL